MFVFLCCLIRGARPADLVCGDDNGMYGKVGNVPKPAAVDLMSAPGMGDSAAAACRGEDGGG